MIGVLKSNDKDFDHGIQVGFKSLIKERLEQASLWPRVARATKPLGGIEPRTRYQLAVHPIARLSPWLSPRNADAGVVGKKN